MNGWEKKGFRAEAQSCKGLVHKMLGPGLLESAYDFVMNLAHDLTGKRNRDQDVPTISAAMIPHDTQLPESPCRSENCKVFCRRALS